MRKFRKNLNFVKKYHPDKNQGSKKYEDKLKKITLAYSQLRTKLENDATNFISNLIQKFLLVRHLGLTQKWKSKVSLRRMSMCQTDLDYKFDKDTTLAILAGFSFNKRVLIQGYHGTGKSTHIEQVARLNWPCIRVNLDSHIQNINW